MSTPADARDVGVADGAHKSEGALKLAPHVILGRPSVDPKPQPL
jgi:hypothetical protein